MTTLDPSHFPSLGIGSSNDRTQGAATHPVRLDNLTASSDIDQEDDLPSPTSSFFDSKDLPLRLSTFQLPDLRFEQGYLMSLMPFFHFHPTTSSPEKTHHQHQVENQSRTSEPYVFGRQDRVEDLTPVDDDNYYLGSNFYVEWKMVVYVTLRDQLFYPLIQGCIWGSASLVISHLWKIRPQKRKLHTRHNLESSSAPIVSKPGSIWDRVVSSIWGGVQTNTTL
ncbi:hypothetical protein PSTT_06648 [Puccinia striiformis]|uniref:Uncharacterized protein n=1 Tax=Puccinia striiformis TaxID=27350 RepID=A0A2S4VJB4_9BASI|nr:hypothetical protein PSTT_06648 [Puccinia striiformis]